MHNGGGAKRKGVVIYTVYYTGRWQGGTSKQRGRGVAWDDSRKIQDGSWEVKCGGGEVQGVEGGKY